MRLSTEIGIRGTWRVELRPMLGGPVMVCALCAPRSFPVEPARAQSAVLGHLAWHAREDAVPRYLRTCQCRDHGCRWHPRHRGCGGAVALVLAREDGGRQWRLADTCTACATATPQAAIVRDASADEDSREPRHRACYRQIDEARRRERTRVREMLNYLASALPSFTSPTARVLALQCALRADSWGRVCLPEGFLRGMRLSGYVVPWTELEHARWLRCRRVYRRARSERLEVQLLDDAMLAQAPGRGERVRAAHWALRPAPLAIAPGAPPALQLVALSLAAHTPSDTASADAEHLARMCALSVEQVEGLLDRLVRADALASWNRIPQTGAIVWHLARRPSLVAGRFGGGCDGKT